jgi:hypothetical protein
VESDAPALALGQQEFLYLGPKMQPKVAHYAGSDGNLVTSNATKNIHQLLDLLGIQTKLLPMC